MPYLQTPLRDVFKAFTATLQSEPKIYVSRNLMRILDEQKNWVDAISQFEPVSIAQQIPVYLGFLLIPELFDIRTLNALGIKQLLLESTLEPFSLISVNNITGSTDFIRQTYRLTIDVESGINTYLQTGDLNQALQTAYTGRLQIQLPNNQYTTDKQVIGQQVSYHDKKHDVVYIGIPIVYFALDYINLLEEPITSNTLYTVYQVGNGRSQIQLYTDYWYRYKQVLSAPIDNIQQIAYCIVFMAPETVNTLNPVYILCNEQDKEQLVLSTQNYWQNQLNIPFRYFAIVMNNAQFAIQVEYNKRLIIDMTHHTLMNQYPECRLCIAYTKQEPVTETKPLNVYSSFNANKDPAIYLSYIDSDNVLHERIPLLIFVDQLYKENKAMFAPSTINLLQNHKYEFLLSALLPNLFTLR